ncbi:hypothetical protein MAIT1_00604 [Magnetofaba australis IT-1]|uniref:Uncharacterized protein n=2 Tax=Magnetofaba TaxID=1472292 RepID=A0A1Y2JZ35_9PROT|nr:hypothetical protein MAIT1_00604 [Magnetofaba australis IT-1]
MTGSGPLQWNAAAWFGATIGFSFWLLPVGLAWVEELPMLGALFLSAWALANISGATMWRFRDRLPPHPAMQAQLTTLFAASVTAMAGAKRDGLLIEFVPHWDHPQRLFGLLVVFPLLMAALAIREHRYGR